MMATNNLMLLLMEMLNKSLVNGFDLSLKSP